MEMFKINEHIELRLEKDNTEIYVARNHFRQCKYLLLNIPAEEFSTLDEIKSIDELEDKYDPDLENNEEIMNNAHELAQKILKIEQLEKLFIQTSIYNIFSIIQLVSAALSIFDDQHGKLTEIFENHLELLNCK